VSIARRTLRDGDAYARAVDAHTTPGHARARVLEVRTVSPDARICYVAVRRSDLLTMDLEAVEAARLTWAGHRTAKVIAWSPPPYSRQAGDARWLVGEVYLCALEPVQERDCPPPDTWGT